MRLRSLHRSLSVAVLIGAATWAMGARFDAQAGDPVVERFTAAEIGQPIDAQALVHDPLTARLYVGTETGLLSYDGKRWRTHELPRQMTHVKPLLADGDGRIWITADPAEIGYLTPAPDGSLDYQSLADKLPRDGKPDTYQSWLTARRYGDVVYFVSFKSLLRWDGKEFTPRHFFGKERIFAFHFEDRLWLHDLDEGLFRVEASGPVLVAAPAKLPKYGIVGMLRHERDLWTISRDGICSLDDYTVRADSPALRDFLFNSSTVQSLVLPDGNRIIATFSGLAVVSPRNELVRVIGHDEGLPSPRATGMLLTHDNQLWVATSSGVARFDPNPAVTRIPFTGPNSLNPSVVGLAFDDRRVAHVVTDIGIFRRATAGAPAKALRLDPLPATTDPHWGAVSTPQGIVTARIRGLDLISDGQTKKLHELKGAWFTQLAGSTRSGLYLASGVAVGEFTLNETEELSFTPRGTNPVAATSIIDRPNGDIYLGLQRGGLRRALAGTSELVDVTPAAAAAVAASVSSVVTADHHHAYAFVGPRLYRVQPDGRTELLGHSLPGPARLAVLMSDRRQIVVLFDRSGDVGPAQGIGLITLNEAGQSTAWSLLAAPDLPTLGTPKTLALEPTAQATLWVGGTLGVLRLRLDELGPWTPPPIPRIEPKITGAGSDVAALELPFSGHRVQLHLTSPLTAQRRFLGFQTRLGPDAPWSKPSDRDSFEFSNLTEGTYVFMARTVNPAGQVSEPAYFTFVILPPWYRTGWAYAGYAALILAGGVGAIRYREARIRARNRELEELVHRRTEELVIANAAKDEFLASMSHEIRNPMNGVVGLSAAIDTTPLDAEGQHRFELLRHCATHLATLLEDILDFTRLQSGRVDLHEQPFSPAEILTSVVAITSAESAAAGMPLKTAIAPGVPAHVTGDARRLRQILLNFVSNALKYAGRGDIELTLWSRPAGPDRVELTFAVTDDGPGITAEEQVKVFSKFERGHAARQARIPGTGMGLAVCRTLAERMGGRVWLESEPGHGSTFYLAVPVPVAAGPAVTPEADALDQIERTVLIVDDEEYNRIALATLLQRHGFQTRTAPDGGTALTLAAAERFDVICLDYDLPDIQGPELARRLRAQHSQHGHQPILLANTAYSTVEKREECLAAGMDAFLGKPVSPERLREALNAALAARGHLSPRNVFVPTPAPEPAHRGEDSDLLSNLRVIAESQQLPLDRIVTDFAGECAREFEVLHEALLRADALTSGRAAHQLAGRFGFLRARSVAELALELERCCRASQWEPANELAARLAAEWDALLSSLTARPAGPAASDHS